MGYYTSSLLCMPVKNSYEEIIAVAQINNKNPDKDDGHFTSMDEKVDLSNEKVDVYAESSSCVLTDC